MKFASPRLAVVLLGDRLCGAVVQQNRMDAFVIQSESPAAALRAELDARGVAPRSVALGLARAAVTVKPIELPLVGGQTRDMVRFELERHLPFPAEDAPFDFLALEPEGEPGQPSETRRVLIAAADRRVVDAALRLAEDAKLRPVSITVAAHDLLALARPERGQRVAWVHRAGDTADVLLARGDALVGSRSVPAADPGALATEIRRSFAVARWRGCDAVWVSGDDAAALAGPLAALGAPVTEPPYTKGARQCLDALGEGPRGAAELALAVASGGRIRPLDLIPAAIKPRRLTRPQWITAGMAAATLLLGVGALLAPGFREHRRLTALNTEIARIDPEVRAVERVLRDLEAKRQLLDTVAGLEAAAVRPLPVLRELTEILPNDAWLTMLAFDAKGVELTGQASQASLLIPLLENSPRLERAEFASPVTRGRDKEQFRIRAAWETQPAAPAPAPAAPAVGAPPGARSGVARPRGGDGDDTTPPALRQMPGARPPAGGPDRVPPAGRRP
jgi:Tfp pilus assembly protein PilN